MASRISPYVDNTGLVFAYDLANVQRSYLGKPTTNRFATEITDPTLDSLAIGNGAGSNPQLGSGGTCAIALFNGEKVLAINRGDSTGAYFDNRVYWSIALTAGNYYSWSAWVYSTVAGPTLRLEYYGGDYNWGVAQSYNTHTGTGWERLYAYASAPASSNTQTYCFIYVNTNNNIYAKDFQLENQQYPTQFTTGTRSVTQGLKDLTGRSTIDLTNVSFDANAQMTFDGTDDYIVFLDGLLSGTGDFTVEAVVQADASEAGGTVFGNYPSGNLQVFFGQRFIGMWLDNASTYLGTSPWSVTLPEFTTQPIHIIAQREGTTTRLYLNAVLKKTGSSSATIGSNSAAFRAGTNTGTSEQFTGDIYLLRVYNRALSASEIQQNFNAIKGRYGL